MRFKCTQCSNPSDKGYSWVETTWCPISLQILDRKWDILCRPCYLSVAGFSKPQTMMEYTELALQGVQKVEKTEEKVMATTVEMPE